MNNIVDKKIDKKTIFLSHHSRDEKILRVLKEILLKKFNNTIKIFLSSDGQSIPFGKNWVHKIEEALDDASLMFVFLSPNSLRSNWIYFEAGYAYSKRINVIPIGILGVDLTMLDPPLSLLQGFNILSENSLNNIINIINETFNFTFPEDFSENEYNNVFQIRNVEQNSHFREYAHIIIRLTLEEEFPKNSLSKIDSIKKYLKRGKNPFQEADNEIHIHGLSISWQASENDILFQFLFDPLITVHTFPIFKQIHKILSGNKVENFSFIIWINKKLSFLEERYQQTAKMFKSEISLREDNRFQFKNIIFKLERHYDYQHQSGSGFLDFIKGPIKIFVECPHGQFNDVPLYELINKLFQYEIMSYSHIEDYE